MFTLLGEGTKRDANAGDDGGDNGEGRGLGGMEFAVLAALSLASNISILKSPLGGKAGADSVNFSIDGG